MASAGRIIFDLLALSRRRREVQLGVPPTGDVIVWRRCPLVEDVDLSEMQGVVMDECNACGRAIWYTLSQPQPYGPEQIMCSTCCSLGGAIRSALGRPVLADEEAP